MSCRLRFLIYIVFQIFSYHSLYTQSSTLTKYRVVFSFQQQIWNSLTDCKWAASWQNQQSECVPSEDSDQPGHPPRLSRVFACAQWVAKDSSFLHADSEDWSDWADAQSETDLSLRYAHNHIVGFVTRRLKCKVLKVHCISCIKLVEPRHDKTNKMTYVSSEDLDQSGHLPSLISLLWPPKGLVLSYPQRRVIRLCRCPGFSECRPFCRFCRALVQYLKHRLVEVSCICLFQLI